MPYLQTYYPSNTFEESQSHKIDYNRSNCSSKNKLDLKNIAHNACTSLNDVEYFLNNFTNSLKYIKLIKLLK